MDEEDTGLTFRMPQLMRRYKLEAVPHILKTIQGCAKVRCTQKECAAVLGVSHETLLAFFEREPVAREVWEAGKLLARASLRRTLWRQAQTDPAQARFLAKDTRWLAMDEGKDRNPDVPSSVTNILNLTSDQQVARIEELQKKVIGHASAKPGRIITVKPSGAG